MGLHPTTVGLSSIGEQEASRKPLSALSALSALKRAAADNADKADGSFPVTRSYELRALRTNAAFHMGQVPPSVSCYRDRSRLTSIELGMKRGISKKSCFLRFRLWNHRTRIPAGPAFAVQGTRSFLVPNRLSAPTVRSYGNRKVESGWFFCKCAYS